MRILIINWQDIKHPMGGGARCIYMKSSSASCAKDMRFTLYCCAFPGAPAEENLNGIHIIREGSRPFFNYHVPLKYFSTFRHQHFDLIVDDMNKIPFYSPMYVKEPLLGITHHLFGKSIFLEASYPAAAYVYLGGTGGAPDVQKTSLHLSAHRALIKKCCSRDFPRNGHI